MSRALQCDRCMGRSARERMAKNRANKAKRSQRSSDDVRANTPRSSDPVRLTPTRPVPEEKKPLAPDKPARPPDPVFEAIIQACGLDLDELTKSARGAANKAAKELREVGATPDGIRARAKVHRKRWPDAECTPSSLAKNYAQLNAKTAAADTGRREPEFGTPEWEARQRERQERAEALTGGGT